MDSSRGRRSVNEDPWSKPECPGNAGELYDAHMDLGPLDMADVVAVESGEFRQHLLAPATLGAQDADAPPQLAGERRGLGQFGIRSDHAADNSPIWTIPKGPIDCRAVRKRTARMHKSISSRQYAHFIKSLRQAREKAGLTQEMLAARLGATQAFVSKSERGERRVDIVELRAFCRAIGISMEQFIKNFEKELS